jgi:hypothetical protein
MNARTLPESVLSASLYAQAVTNISTAEQFSDWLCAEDDDRQMSAFFGAISTPELFASVLLQDRATDAQIVAAWKEARQRFLEGKADRIADEFKRLAEQE